MNLPFIVPKTPAFRAGVLQAATRIILSVSPNGKWLDVLAVRGNDRVYVTTLANKPDGP